MESIANQDCFVYHVEPDGKDRHYLGWCHGAAGTGRLYQVLWRITAEKKWLDKLKKSATAVIASGIPEKQTPGFWNNVSMCCGSAGLVRYFLNLYDVRADKECLRFARRTADDLLAKAAKEGSGLKWPQAEHRKHPELIVAQTGYMQGASGIGMALLHLAQFDKEREPESYSRIRLLPIDRPASPTSRE
jgi:lantibiotic modifying enzyme